MKKKIFNLKSLMLVGIILVVWVIIILNNAANEDEVMEYDADMIIEYALFRESIGDLSPHFSQMMEQPDLKFDENWNKGLKESLNTIKRSADGLVVDDYPRSRKEQQETAKNVRDYAHKFVDNYLESIETRDIHLEDKAVEYLHFVQDEVEILDEQMRKDWEK